MANWLGEHQVVMAGATVASGVLAVLAAVVATGDGRSREGTEAAMVSRPGALPPEPARIADAAALSTRMAEGPRFERVDAIREALSTGDRTLTAEAIQAYFATKPAVPILLEEPENPRANHPLSVAYRAHGGTLRLADFEADRDLNVRLHMGRTDYPYEGVLIAEGLEVTGGSRGCTLRLDEYEDGALNGVFRCGLNDVSATMPIE